MPSIAFFVYVWPEPLSSAAGIRTTELARILREEGFAVHAFSPCSPNAAMAAWEAEGITCHPCPANDSGAEELLARVNPAFVFYDRFVMEEFFGWRLRARWPAAVHVVDTQDLHALRRAREKMVKQGESAAAAALPAEENYAEDILRELAALHRADAAFVVSPVERDWLVARGYPADRVVYLPFSAVPETTPPGFAERDGFCLLGNFRHAPNLDSVHYTVREIWPLIRREIPNARLYLYGAYPSATVSALAGKHGISVPGQVADHRRGLAKHRVLLAPLRFGAGIKGKVLEAYACGTAVAGTPIAFEGILDGHGESGTEGLAAAACTFHRDENAWHADTARGRNRLAEDFSPLAVKQRFRQFLAQAPARREEWRAGLTGRMLRLQQNNATKYFSLWIEAKNKKGAGA